MNHFTFVLFGEMGVNRIVAVQNEMIEINDVPGGVIVITEKVIQRDMEKLRDFPQCGKIRFPLPALVSIIADRTKA